MQTITVSNMIGTAIKMIGYAAALRNRRTELGYRRQKLAELVDIPLFGEDNDNE